MALHLVPWLGLGGAPPGSARRPPTGQGLRGGASWLHTVSGGGRRSTQVRCEAPGGRAPPCRAPLRRGRPPRRRGPEVPAAPPGNRFAARQEPERRGYPDRGGGASQGPGPAHSLTPGGGPPSASPGQGCLFGQSCTVILPREPGWVVWRFGRGVRPREGGRAAARGAGGGGGLQGASPASAAPRARQWARRCVGRGAARGRGDRGARTGGRGGAGWAPSTGARPG